MYPKKVCSPLIRVTDIPQKGLFTPYWSYRYPSKKLNEERLVESQVWQKYSRTQLIFAMGGLHSCQ